MDLDGFADLSHMHQLLSPIQGLLFQSRAFLTICLADDGSVQLGKPLPGSKLLSVFRRLHSRHVI